MERGAREHARAERERRGAVLMIEFLIGCGQGAMFGAAIWIAAFAVGYRPR